MEVEGAQRESSALRDNQHGELGACGKAAEPSEPAADGQPKPMANGEGGYHAAGTSGSDRSTNLTQPVDHQPAALQYGIGSAANGRLETEPSGQQTQMGLNQDSNGRRVGSPRTGDRNRSDRQHRKREPEAKPSKPTGAETSGAAQNGTTKSRKSSKSREHPSGQKDGERSSRHRSDSKHAKDKDKRSSRSDKGKERDGDARDRKRSSHRSEKDGGAGSKVADKDKDKGKDKSKESAGKGAAAEDKKRKRESKESRQGRRSSSPRQRSSSRRPASRSPLSRRWQHSPPRGALAHGRRLMNGGPPDYIRGPPPLHGARDFYRYSPPRGLPPPGWDGPPGMPRPGYRYGPPRGPPEPWPPLRGPPPYSSRGPPLSPGRRPPPDLPPPGWPGRYSRSPSPRGRHPPPHLLHRGPPSPPHAGGAYPRWGPGPGSHPRGWAGGYDDYPPQPRPGAAAAFDPYGPPGSPAGSGGGFRREWPSEDKLWTAQSGWDTLPPESGHENGDAPPAEASHSEVAGGPKVSSSSLPFDGPVAGNDVRAPGFAEEGLRPAHSHQLSPNGPQAHHPQASRGTVASARPATEPLLSDSSWTRRDSALGSTGEARSVPADAPPVANGATTGASPVRAQANSARVSGGKAMSAAAAAANSGPASSGRAGRGAQSNGAAAAASSGQASSERGSLGRPAVPAAAGVAVGSPACAAERQATSERVSDRSAAAAPGGAEAAAVAMKQGDRERNGGAESESDVEKCWFYLDPEGRTQGPCSISQFRMWMEHMARDAELRAEYEKFKAVSVWKEGMEVRVPLTDVLNGQHSPSPPGTPATSAPISPSKH